MLVKYSQLVETIIRPTEQVSQILNHLCFFLYTHTYTNTCTPMYVHSLTHSQTCEELIQVASEINPMDDINLVCEQSGTGPNQPEQLLVDFYVSSHSLSQLLTPTTHTTHTTHTTPHSLHTPTHAGGGYKEPDELGQTMCLPREKDPGGCRGDTETREGQNCKQTNKQTNNNNNKQTNKQTTTTSK